MNMKDKIRLFLLACDGSYMIDPHEDLPSTQQMGICYLAYDDIKNVLHVHLKRPGIIIGKGGETIDKLKDFLKCDISLHEVVLGGRSELASYDEIYDVIKAMPFLKKLKLLFN